jgi:hypothetical protein
MLKKLNLINYQEWITLYMHLVNWELNYDLHSARYSAIGFSNLKNRSR